MDEKVPTEPALGISVEATVDNTRKIVFQTFLPQTSTGAQIDELLNKVLGSAERIGAKNQLKVWQHKLQDDEGKLALFKKSLGELDERHKADWGATKRGGEFKLTPQQKQERNACESSIERYNQEINIAKLNIAQYEKTLADAKEAG